MLSAFDRPPTMSLKRRSRIMSTSDRAASELVVGAEDELSVVVERTLVRVAEEKDEDTEKLVAVVGVECALVGEEVERLLDGNNVGRTVEIELKPPVEFTGAAARTPVRPDKMETSTGRPFIEICSWPTDCQATYARIRWPRLRISWHAKSTKKSSRPNKGDHNSLFVQVNRPNEGLHSAGASCFVSFPCWTMW